jgi:hypothetical protein
MRSFWSDSYLWIHLAGLAAFPLFVEGCLIGLALGDPFLPVWLELLLVAAVGIAPILWMQWQRPFYIFSVVAVCLKPAALTDDQRRLLTLFKLPRNRVLAVLASIALAVVLWQIYALAPIAASSVSFLPASRLLGLLLAAGAFLACNLFVQVPLSVASVMLTGEATFAQTVPYQQEQIRQGFSLLGLPLNQILPPIVAEIKPTIAPQAEMADRAVIADSIAAKAPKPTEPNTSDLWEETAAAPEDTPIAGDDQALNVEAVTAELPDAAPESSAVPGESSTQENPVMEDTSALTERPSEAEGDDRVV